MCDTRCQFTHSRESFGPQGLATSCLEFSADLFHPLDNLFDPLSQRVQILATTQSHFHYALLPFNGRVFEDDIDLRNRAVYSLANPPSKSDANGRTNDDKYKARGKYDRFPMLPVLLC